MAGTTTTKVLEETRITPMPPVPPSSLPLTYFDVVWLYATPVERIFLYSFPDPIDIPNLKSSLALTLHHFFPFGGRVRLIPGSTDHHEIHVSDTDSVSFTVAETSIDFNNLISNNPKPSSMLKSLVPQIQQGALLGIQVTLFPGHGLCIGLSVSHVACDGLISVNFMKSWASCFKSNAEIPSMLFDRSLISDRCGLYSEYLNDMLGFKDDDDGALLVIDRAPSNLIHSTFKLGQDDVNALKALIGGRMSSFVATCAYVWACLTKARGYEPDKTVYFTFAVSWRKRMDPVIPETYFGNCIGCCFAEAIAGELVGENGVVAAAEAVTSVIRKMDEGVEKNMKGLVQRVAPLLSEGAFSVAGSPIFGVYEVDFGWGRPAKVEVPSIEATGAMSLAEIGDGCGGFEIGIVLPEQEMDALAANIENGLKFN